MDLEELRTKHKAVILEIANRYGVQNIRIFGSIARGEANAESDLDLLVHMTKPLGFAFAGFQIDLEERIGMPVQAVTDDSLSPYIGPYILKEAVPL